MRLWNRLTRPLGTRRIAQQLLSEQRATRLALERIATALEGQQRQVHTAGAQSFHSPHPQVNPEDHSSVSYVDAAEQAKLLALEADLTKILGRMPTESEMGAAIAEIGA